MNRPGSSDGAASSPSHATSGASPVPVDYYVKDFFLILDTVLARDEHLFRGSELEVFYAIRCLPQDAIRLFVRLFNRIGPYQRVDGLRYEEIQDLRGALALLETRGLLVHHRPQVSGVRMEAPFVSLDLESALRLYTVAELEPLARRLGIKGNRKRALVQGLLGALEVSPIANALLQLAELVEIEHRPLLSRVQRLFFLNRHQDSTTMVTVNLARIRFPGYRVWRTRPVFQTREAFEAFLAAEEERQAFERAWLEGDRSRARQLGHRSLELVLDSWPAQSGFLRRYDAFAVRVGTALAYLSRFERALDPGVAVERYGALLDLPLSERHRGPAWLRRATLLAREGRLSEAQRACRDGLEDPAVREGDRVALRNKLRTLEGGRGRLRRGLGALEPPTRRRDEEEPLHVTPGLQADGRAPREVVVRSRLVSAGRGRRLQFAGTSRQVLTVESVALEAYRLRGMDGIRTENTFFTTLFGLLFWDIIFMDIPDVFQNPYQDAPLDFGTDHFYEARRDAIEQRLRALQDDCLRILRAHHGRYRGIQARGIAWEAFSLEELINGSTRLGGARVAGIMEKLARDYAAWRRGLPDLLVWSRGDAGKCGRHPGREAPSLPPDYRPPADVWFVEVKSARDRLGSYQTAWIRTLNAMGLVVEICRVLDATDQEKDGGSSLGG